jgi:hypothetical protein
MQISNSIKANSEFIDMFNAQSIIARQDKITVNGSTKNLPMNVKDRDIIDSIDSAKRMDEYSRENYKRANGTYSNLKPKF